MGQTPLKNKYDFALRYDPQRNAWSLIGTNPSTGQAAFEFPNLSQGQLQMFQSTPLGPPAHKLAQSTGNLLLLSMGQYAYCFDLFEKKQLWQRNLLGEDKLNQIVQLQIQQKEPWETIVTDSKGWSMRLGSSSILQPTYASLLTRDGLVVLDPRTGKELWTRENIPSSVQMFGDAEHIYLVENEKTSHVYRSLDGFEIKGVPQFADLLKQGHLGILNRRLLQYDSEDEKPTQPSTV